MSSRSLISWQPWSEDAFARALREQKPVLLRIGASWCAVCRAMEGESDADPYVARTVLDEFVPVYVDTDLRPDVNERYNLGGWPTNAFLTPRGGLITGGTYFPVETFRVLVARVAENWRENRADVEEAVTTSRRALEHKRLARPVEEVPSADAIDFVVDRTMEQFDFRHGGFGGEPKFPHADSIELLLREFLRTGEAKLRDAAIISLEALWKGGKHSLADPGGGFYRYAAFRDWSEPSYEKRLDEHARLLSVFLSAHQLTGEPRWAAAARSVLAFVESTLVDRARTVFGASQAAGMGALYYSLAPEARKAYPAPPVDRTVLVGWNAEMASAYVKAGVVLGLDPVTQFGARVADRLAIHARFEPEDDAALGHVWRDDDRVVGPVTLADQVYSARALVDVYEAIGGPARLERAAAILDAAHSRLRLPVRDAYTDIPVERGAEGYLDQPIFPLAENSVAADTLLRLAVHLDAPSLRERAQAVLKYMASAAAEGGMAAAPYALAVMRALDENILTVNIAGRSADPERALALGRSAHAVFAPLKYVRYLEADRDAPRLRSLGLQGQTGAWAVVCKGMRCAESTSDPSRVLALIARAASANV